MKTTTCQTSQRDGEFDPEMSRAAYFRAHPLICDVTFDRWCFVVSAAGLQRHSVDSLASSPARDSKIVSAINANLTSWWIAFIFIHSFFYFFLLVINLGFKL